MVGWSDWLSSSLVRGCFIGSLLVYRLVAWLAYCLVCWSVCWLLYSLVYWLVCWWCIVWFLICLYWCYCLFCLVQYNWGFIDHGWTVWLMFWLLDSGMDGWIDWFGGILACWHVGMVDRLFDWLLGDWGLSWLFSALQAAPPNTYYFDHPFWRSMVLNYIVNSIQAFQNRKAPAPHYRFA